MSRIANILSNVRIDLGDKQSTRYSDTILVRHLNTAINEFIVGTECLKERLYVGLNTSSAIYDVRPYAIKFIRAEYNNRKIEAKSFTELDVVDKDWQVTIGDSVKYITFDHLSKGMFRIYPRVSGAMNIVTQNQQYGGLIDITIGDDDYQIPSIEDVTENIEQYLVIYIVKKHSTVTVNTIDTALEIPTEYDTALENYIKAMCLRSDTDAINRAYGNECLQLYLGYVEAAKISETLVNNTIQDRIINYRSAFE